jgi:hypothetical protein
MNSESIIDDICQIAARPHDKKAFRELVERLYKLGVIDGNLQAIKELREVAA